MSGGRHFFLFLLRLLKVCFKFASPVDGNTATVTTLLGIKVVIVHCIISHIYYTSGRHISKSFPGYTVIFIDIFFLILWTMFIVVVVSKYIVSLFGGLPGPCIMPGM